MKKLTGLLSLLLLANGLNAQMISLNPADADGDNEVSIIFDAAVGNGEMVGADKV